MKKIILILISLVSFNFLHATTRNVPAQFSTIQLALNACSSGDTVLVAPGTYYEHLIWPQVMDIKLLSSGNKANTIIDGSKNGRVILIDMPSTGIVTQGTQVKGFSIIHGQLNLSDLVPEDQGAGIYLNNASPKFVNCNINKNYIVSEESATDTKGFGGGVYCNNSSAAFKHCTFKSNRSKYIEEMYGTALYAVSSMIEFSNCEISKNVTKTNFGNGQPTGIIYGESTSFTINQCVVRDNNIDDESESYPSGTIAILNGSADITNTLFTNNVHEGASELSPIGSVLYAEASDVNMIHVTSANNGGVLSVIGASIYAINNNSNTITVMNSIFYNYNAYEEVSIDGPANISISYSDVKGVYAGIGNISSNPQFITSDPTNKSLKPTSPCAGAGNASLILPVDIDGTIRPLPAGTPPDMGCYEINQPLKMASVTATSVMARLYPNPSHEVMTIDYETSHDGIIRIDIVDPSGRSVKNVINRFGIAGSYQQQVTLHELSSGSYCIRISETGQTTLLPFILD